MSYKKGTFRQFVEEADYFDGLYDELGIDAKNRNKVLKKEPWVNSHFNLGGVNYKTAAWEIKQTFPDGSAIIVLKNMPGQKAYMGKTRYQGPPDEKEYRLSKKELIQLLTVGWTPALAAQQGAAGGMDAGMPPPPPDASGAQPGGL